MTSKLKTDVLETVSGSGTIALTNQLSGMTSASMPSGSVIQVANLVIDTETTASSTSWVYAGGSEISFSSLTSTGSKVLVRYNLIVGSSKGSNIGVRIYRNVGGAGWVTVTPRPCPAVTRPSTASAGVSAVAVSCWAVLRCARVRTKSTAPEHNCTACPSSLSILTADPPTCAHASACSFANTDGTGSLALITLTAVAVPSERVGKGGSTLSAGECQLIAFARTSLQNVKIVCLDEPTANLDSESDRKVQNVVRSRAYQGDDHGTRGTPC